MKYAITFAPEAKEGLAKLKRSEPASYKKASLAFRSMNPCAWAVSAPSTNIAINNLLIVVGFYELLFICLQIYKISPNLQTFFEKTANTLREGHISG